MFRRMSSLPVLVLVLAATGTIARAQLPADAYWRDGFQPAGLQGYVYAIRPFGNGVLVGGKLDAVEDRPVANVVRFELEQGLLADGRTLGDGLNGPVMSFGEHSGDLIAGGQFSRSDRTVVESVARWDGKSWQPIGAGLPGVTVKALASYGGDLYAGAYRWDGAAWGNVLQTDGAVSFLAEHDGLLYVGGSFTTAAGVPVNHAFAWDGESVLPLGAGLSGPAVGMAVVGGAVAFACNPRSGPGYVALWENGTWSTILPGVQVESIAAWGDRLAVSYWQYYVPYLLFPYLRTWQAGTWTGVGGFSSRLMVEQADDLLIVADSDAVPGIVSPGLIAHDGAGFRAAFASGRGCDDGFYSLAPIGDAAVVAGSFRIAGGRSFDRVALAAEGIWYPWGAGSDITADGSFADVALVGAETYGVFSRFVSDITEFELCHLEWQDGLATWRRLDFGSQLWGTELVPFGSDLYLLHSGELRRVALPTGMSFPEPGLDLDGYLTAACAHEGVLVVGGRLEANGGVPCGHVLRRDGGTWHDLGNPAGATGVEALASLGTEGLAAAFRDGAGPACRVALFDGSDWLPLGGRFDYDVTRLVVHRGHLFAAGGFDRIGDSEVHGLAMWSGTAWISVGSGVTGQPYWRVADMVSAGRNLWLCGEFTRAGGRPSAGLACWSGDPAELAALSAVPTASVGGNALLSPAWPNPFNPRTELAFTLPVAGRARLSLHDARGALVRTLVDGDLAAGVHRPTWDGTDEAGRPAASGAYLARLEAGGAVESVKLVLVR